MTDRFDSLTVVLDKDIREDDAVLILNAISMIKGVAIVGGNISDPQSYVAEQRVRRDLEKKLWEALHSNIETQNAG